MFVVVILYYYFLMYVTAISGLQLEDASLYSSSIYRYARLEVWLLYVKAVSTFFRVQGRLMLYEKKWSILIILNLSYAIGNRYYTLHTIQLRDWEFLNDFCVKVIRYALIQHYWKIVLYILHIIN